MASIPNRPSASYQTPTRNVVTFSPRDLTNYSKMRMLAIILILSLPQIYSSAQSPTETADPQETATKTTYLVLYRPGPAWLTGKSVMEQPLKEHGKYMLSLYIKGSMKLAGSPYRQCWWSCPARSLARGRGKGDCGERPGSEIRSFCIRNAPLEIAAMGRV